MNRISHGMTFRGRHCTEFGIVVKTKSRPAAPPVRTVEETVPFRDGAVDCSRQGGRLYYEDKLLELEVTIPRTATAKTQEAVSEVVAWLYGSDGWYGDLIFDDMPYIIWEARPLELSEVAMELSRIGRVTVQFRCRPFNKLRYQSTGILLEDMLPLGATVRLEYGADAEMEFSNLAEKNPDPVAYAYIGSAPVAPMITVCGNPTIDDSVAVRVNDRSVTYNMDLQGAEKSFVCWKIDCETWRSYVVAEDGSTAEMTRYVSGEYPELRPGENWVSVTTPGTSVDVVRVEICCEPRFLYGDVGFAVHSV